ncbi:HET-domain-containing protein [Hyaloscypha bicolor E]|uniref:HET-domain-containing protein n=1 Tax=Hyaloscypha bicolor E TaxID=1095630 RepID=A0A2J6T970_9HELO|nr:HET-domain-containing protein [Hyaloscypha bicolor E]PMD59555.1 HET-domain-containing protein [Hyaloscypha bicolor E]
MLYEAAAIHCPICERILGAALGNAYPALLMKDSFLWDKKLDISYIIFDYSTASECNLEIKVHEESFGHFYLSVKEDLSRLPSRDIIDELATYTPSSWNTNSNECWELIGYWIRNCIQNHQNCPNLVASDTSYCYPTRLIDIGDRGAYLDRPRLLVSSDSLMAGGYATLSHRWGGSTPTTVSSDTLSEFKNGFIRSSLPQTFQDALLATKQLGLRYLWIDSLCIIQSGQGSADDWACESNRMDQVYRHAYCNISATGSEDTNYSIFHYRHPETISCPRFRLEWDSKNKHKITCSKEHNLVDNWTFHHRLDSSALLKRGWVFQERLLAPRIIHLGTDQLYWECDSLQACETIPLGIGMTFGSVKRMVSPSIPSEVRQDHKSRMESTWDSIIFSYTACDLTKPKDKLIALSGVANRYAAIHNLNCNTYFAGHWRHALPRSLLWHRSLRHAATENLVLASSAPYIAPTWSWASVIGRVVSLCTSQESHRTDLEGTVYPKPENLAILLDVATSTIPSAPTGQVKSGEIKLYGNLFCLVQHRDLDIIAEPGMNIKADYGTHFDQKLYCSLDMRGIALDDLCCVCLLKEILAIEAPLEDDDFSEEEDSSDGGYSGEKEYSLDRGYLREEDLPDEQGSSEARDLSKGEASRVETNPSEKGSLSLSSPHEQLRAVDVVHEAIYGLLLVKTSEEEEVYQRVGMFCLVYWDVVPEFCIGHAQELSII